MGYKYQYNKTLAKRAQINKRKSTDAERKLWSHLRNRILNGNKFRRQYAIRNYILDFYCVEKKLAIEVDGGQHMKNKVYDKKRTIQLENIGIKTLRFWDSEILTETNEVLEKILLELERLS